MIRFLLRLAACGLTLSLVAHLSAQTYPLAAGKSKFLGSALGGPSASVNFSSYFNQVVPENASKWGSVEAVRDVMNWTEVDAAYQLAKSNGWPFRFHVLIWGHQQPAWIETLPPAEQLEEIKEWFAAVAARYPDIDYLEVLNEPLREDDRPVGTGAGRGNYMGALGGAGASGWDWVLTSFRLARTYFPDTPLMLNQYGLADNTNAMQNYVGIVKLLQAENLIDLVGMQTHAFETIGGSTTTITANIDRLAATGLPIMVTEMEIDGPSDQIQLNEYRRVFPLFWEHPSVMGITLWGYLPPMWRGAQGANLVRADGTEKPAMGWLRTYLQNQVPAVSEQSLIVTRGAATGTVVGYLQGVDPDGPGTLRDWRIVSGGSAVFAVDADSGEVTVKDGGRLSATSASFVKIGVTVADGRDTSVEKEVTIHVLVPGSSTTRLVNLAVRSKAGGGDRVLIMGFVLVGSGPKPLLLRGLGPTLTSLQVAGALPDTQLKLYNNVPVKLDENDDWGGSPALVELFARLGALPLATNTKDSALSRELNPGVYSAHVTTPNAATGVAMVEAYDAGDSGTTRFVNLSARAEVLTGDDILIAGFVITGNSPKTLLIRAEGPGLTPKGVSGALANPVIRLYKEGVKLLENDDWGGSVAMKRVFSQVGAQPFSSDRSRDSALLVTLSPGVYSAQVSGVNGTTGVALVEIYEVP